MGDFLYRPGSKVAHAEAGAEIRAAPASSLQQQFWEAKSTSQRFPSVQSCLLKKNTLVPFTLNTAGTNTTRNIAYSRFLSLPVQAELRLQKISASARSAGPPSQTLPLCHRQGAGGSLRGAEHSGGCGGSGWGFTGQQTRMSQMAAGCIRVLFLVHK